MKTDRAVLLATLSAGIIATSGAAHATVSIALSVERLSKEAHAIVIGQVLQRQSRWSSNKARILTFTRVQVKKVLKGRVGDSEVMIRQWGGVVGKIGMKVAGNAKFRVGEEVVLFLTTDNNYHFVVGMAQGKYSITQDAKGRKVLSRDLSGMAFAKWDPRGRMTIVKSSKLHRPLYLSDLEAQIKLALTK